MISDEALDRILAVQLAVAWAGEGRCSPRRLGWWDTDLLDQAGGGDLLTRLLPQTQAWAALEAVREAARRVDAKARSKLADPDRLRSLFFLGFVVDEQIGDRLREHKRAGRAPALVLPQPLNQPLVLQGDFRSDAFSSSLRSDDVTYAIAPGGRQVKGACPSEPDVMARRLAAALVPLADQYPLPFYSVGSGA